MSINIERDLVNHIPNENTQRVMEATRYQYHTVAEVINGIEELRGRSRELSLAATHLEQSLMYAMAALARSDYDRKDSE